MEFIYSAFNNTQALPIKGKISRWRHLETTVTQFVLLGLLLFLIMQNGNLRKQISDKLSHETMEDIFTEKMVQVTKEMEEVKMLLLETSKRNSLQSEQLKKIIKILIKEIGFPLPITTQEATKFHLNPEYYEVVQGSERDRSPRSLRQGIESKQEIEEEDYQEYSEEEENSEDNDEGDEVMLENETDPEGCNYLEYLGNAVNQKTDQIVDNLEDEDDNSQEGEEQQDSLPDEKMNNKSNQTEDEDEEEADKDYHFRTYLTLFKSILIVGGNLLLVFLAFVCLFILRSVIKNPKYRSKSEETFENILKVGSKGKEHHSHSMPQKKILSL